MLLGQNAYNCLNKVEVLYNVDTLFMVNSLHCHLLRITALGQLMA